MFEILNKFQLLKQRHLPTWLHPRFSQVLVSQIGTFAATGRAHNETFLDKERLANLLDGAGVLAYRRGDGVHADRAALELVDDGGENLVVHVVEAMLVHVEGLQADAGDVDGDGAVALYLGEVADATQQKVAKVCAS